MSESMIEKVARALNAEITQPQYAILDTVPGRDAALVAVTGLARAAIEAMRDPTDAMAEAMFNACRDIPRTGVVPEDIERAFDCWRAGIATALSEDGTEARSP